MRRAPRWPLKARHQLSGHVPSCVAHRVAPVSPDVACVHRSWRGPYAPRPTNPLQVRRRSIPQMCSATRTSQLSLFVRTTERRVTSATSATTPATAIECKVSSIDDDFGKHAQARHNRWWRCQAITSCASSIPTGSCAWNQLEFGGRRHRRLAQNSLVWLDCQARIVRARCGFQRIRIAIRLTPATHCHALPVGGR